MRLRALIVSVAAGVLVLALPIAQAGDTRPSSSNVGAGNQPDMTSQSPSTHVGSGTQSPTGQQDTTTPQPSASPSAGSSSTNSHTNVDNKTNDNRTSGSGPMDSNSTSGSGSSTDSTSTGSASPATDQKAPTTTDDCREGDWQKYGFKTQGECLGAVNNQGKAK